MTATIVSRPPIIIRWGAAFENELNLNDGEFYNGETTDMFAGPEMDVLMQDQLYDSPYDVRSKPLERVFSIWFEPRYKAYTNAWQFRKLEAFKALYNSQSGFHSTPIRIVVPRGVIVDDQTTTGFDKIDDSAGDGIIEITGMGTYQMQWIEARVEHIAEKEHGKEGFEVKLTASNPYFTVDDGGRSYRYQLTRYGTGELPDQGQYTPVPMPYMGSAPSEPVITFVMGGRGGVYRYYADISVYNPSVRALVNHPVCIDMGNISAEVGGTRFHEIGGSGYTAPDGSFFAADNIKDIRIESQGGARKAIYIRDSGNAGGTWHESVKVWTILNSLDAGQTKILRVLYGNPNADPAEIYPDASTIKSMFSMFTSDNTHWDYNDFMPRRDYPQTRSKQWTLYQPPGAPRLTPITTNDKRFGGFSEGNVPAAGAYVNSYGAVSGSAGLQLVTPLAVNHVAMQAQVSTNAKVPLILRYQHRDGTWTDTPNNSTGYFSDGDSVWRTTLRSNWTSGTAVPVTSLGTTGSNSGGFKTGQLITIPLTDGRVWRAIITSVSGTGPVVNIDAAPGGSFTASSGTYVQASQQISQSWYFTEDDWPAVIAFVLRGDTPTLNSGDWYYGGMEGCQLYFDDSESLQVTAWASRTEHDLENPAFNKFQLTGRFWNTYTGEALRINFITHTLYDKVVVDCINRTCEYFAWNPTTQTYEDAENAFEALTFEQVRQSWIHLQPVPPEYTGRGTPNTLKFDHDANSNFHNSDVIVQYYNRMY